MVVNVMNFAALKLFLVQSWEHVLQLLDIRNKLFYNFLFSFKFANLIFPHIICSYKILFNSTQTILILFYEICPNFLLNFLQIVQTSFCLNEQWTILLLEIWIWKFEIYLSRNAVSFLKSLFQIKLVTPTRQRKINWFFGHCTLYVNKT